MASAANRVTRCVCHNKMFDEIKNYARDQNITSVKELQEHDFCGKGCGLCIPYIKAMLRTGQTVFLPGDTLKQQTTNNK